MGKYYVRFDRSSRYLWRVLYSFFILILLNLPTFAHAGVDLTCSATGIQKITSKPTCLGVTANPENWSVGNFYNETPDAFMYFCVANKNTPQGHTAGYTTHGGSCTKTQNNCTTGNVPPAGNFDGKPYWAFSGKNLSGSICVDSCKMQGTWDGNMQTGSGWSTFFKDSMTVTGESCTPPDENNKDEDGDCGPDMGSVTINGKKRCVPDNNPNPGTDNANNVPKPETKTTEEKSCPTGMAPACTETTTKETKKKLPNGGTETTTTTTTKTVGPNGEVSGETTTTKKTVEEPGNLENDKEDKETKDMCEKNPSLNICKNSVVSGECANTTCEGDAITCAIIKLQRKNDCEVREDTPEKVLGRLIAEDNDPLKANLPSPNNPQNIDFSQLNLSADGWGFGGACIQDKSISVMGKTVTIPFSSICDFLLALRAGIMLLAGLLSFKIVSGVILTV